MDRREHHSPRDALGKHQALHGLNFGVGALPRSALCVSLRLCDNLVLEKNKKKKIQKYLTLCLVPAGLGWPWLCHAQVVEFFSRLSSSIKPPIWVALDMPKQPLKAWKTEGFCWVFFLLLLFFYFPVKFCASSNTVWDKSGVLHRWAKKRRRWRGKAASCCANT